MDKKSIIGLLIVGVILFGYIFYSSKQQQKTVEFQRAQAEQLAAEQAREERERFVRDSIDRANFPEKYENEAVNAGLAIGRIEEEREQARLNADVQLISNIGRSLFDARGGEEQVYTIENDLIKVYISSRGAQVSNVWLKEFRRYHRRGEGDPLMMYEEGTAKFDMEFFMRRSYNEAQVNTIAYNFTSDSPAVQVLADGEESRSLIMRLPVDEAAGAFIEYVYTLHQGDYLVDFKVNFVGMRDFTSNMTDFRFNWGAVTLQNEKGFKNENMQTTLAYRYPGARSVEQLGSSEGTKGKKEPNKVEWVSFKQQFFSSIFVSDDNFTDSEFGFRTFAPGSGFIKEFSSSMSVNYNPAQSEYGFHFYFGPNEFPVLKTYGRKFEKVIPLGGALISWINTGFVIPVFNWLSQHIASFGIIILLLTIMIKLILMPLTYKSYLSSAKMRVLKPEIEEINERYPKPEDAMNKQKATMALYKQYGVSPLGGCLPMLIQMPVLIAMFRFFPASIELRGQSFLWAEDLSAYDSILYLPFKIPMYGEHISLFTLLMAASLFFYSKVNYQQTAAVGGQQMAGMKFMTLYLMPAMMLLWFNSYASGLTYYYMLSQVLTILVMTGFRYSVNEEKLRSQMTVKAKDVSAKPKKKSNFQRRYEEMLRQQQQQVRQQQGGSHKTHTAKPQSTKNQPKKKRR